jgi:hypothetical protein
MGKNILKVLWGMITGTILTFFLLASGFFGFKLGDKAVYFLESKFTPPLDANKFRYLEKKFHIGFEKMEDFELFSFNNSGGELSEKYTSEGKQSLLVEFASGQDITGASFELSKELSFDWSDMREFIIDAFNSTDASARLIIKIKSGSDYPKKTFERVFDLPGSQLTPIKISRAELERELDINKISSLNLFMHDPSTTFLVYFDNIRIEK